ncbi:MAG: hypothetical protein R2853_09315 [Thermomicrobiales bacterium]
MSPPQLDPATERLVHRAFGRLLQGRTGIVAHRLSTFARGRHPGLEAGAVVEQGPRTALAADPGSRYAATAARRRRGAPAWYAANFGATSCQMSRWA